MLQFLKRLKLYTNLGPEAVHKAPISIHIKMHLRLFVDYQHLQSVFTTGLWHWTTTLSVKSISGVI